MEYRHSHPIHIVQSTSRFLILLLFPVLRGLLFSGGNLYIWLSGAWFDILIVLIIFALGYIRWYFQMYRIDSDGIYLYRGIVLIKKEFLPYAMVSSITVERPFYLVPLRAVYVKVDTDAGGSRRVDFSTVMRLSEAEKLLECARGKLMINDRIGKVYRPRILYIAVLSLISSNSLTGVLFLSTLISQSGNLLGQEFEQMLMDNLTRIMEVLAFGIPPIAAVIAYVLIGGWAIAFLMNVVRHKNFTVIRRHNEMEIHAGVIIPRDYVFNTKKINLVEIRQTLITKVLGFYSVYIHCSGYGKLKNGNSVLMPAAEKREAIKTLQLLLPEISFVKRNIKPRKRDFGRFICIPCWIIVLLSAAIAVTYHLFPNFRGLILFFGLMLEIPAGILLIVRIISYTHTGVGVGRGVVTISYTRGFLFDRTSIPVDRISKIVFRSHPFQRRTGCCDIVIYSYAEGTKKHIVKNMNYQESYQLLAPYLSGIGKVRR